MRIQVTASFDSQTRASFSKMSAKTVSFKAELNIVNRVDVLSNGSASTADLEMNFVDEEKRAPLIRMDDLYAGRRGIQDFEIQKAVQSEDLRVNGFQSHNGVL